MKEDLGRQRVWLDKRPGIVEPRDCSSRSMAAVDEENATINCIMGQTRSNEMKGKERKGKENGGRDRIGCG